MIQLVLNIIGFAINKVLIALDNMMMSENISYLNYILLVAINLIIVGFIIRIIPKAISGNGFKFGNGGKDKE